MNVFISYATPDVRKARSLQKALRQARVPFDAIMVADQRDPMKPLAEKVSETISRCDIFIPILSSKSISYQWVNQEIGFAVASGAKIIPITENRIIPALKGFIHDQGDLPFSFDGDESSPRRESDSFRKCYKHLVAHLEELAEPALKDAASMLFRASISPSRVRRGGSYTTQVEFAGEVENGFFDNRVEHVGSHFRTWNWDPATLPNLPGYTLATRPGKLNGNVSVRQSYTHSTAGWPPGKYKIKVRLYSHLIPGMEGRQMIAEDRHELEVY